MTLTFGHLISRAWESVTAPREVARWLMSIEMPRVSRWEALLLIVVISVILAQATTWILVPQGEILMGPILANPLTAGMVQMSLLVMMVFGIHWVGRAMGGTGGFGDAILLVAWIQFVMACLQVVQTLAILVIPPFSGLIAVFGFGLFFWLLTNFIAELHGFRSLGQVFVMVIVTMLGFIFGLSLILAVIGVSIPGAAPA